MLPPSAVTQTGIIAQNWRFASLTFFFLLLEVYTLRKGVPLDFL